MARRNHSALKDLVDLIALLPWWSGVLLAVISYFVIHPFAELQIPAATTANDMGEVVSTSFIRSFAIFGQYLLPALFLIGAAVSGIGRHKRKRLLSNTAEATSQGALKALSWQEFEMLVGEAFRHQGYTVQQTAAGADGGVDLELNKDGEKYLVQCKQWRATKVGVAIVRELFGVMAGRGAVGAFVVTSGSYTKEARSFTEGRNITLIDGPALEEMVLLAKKTRIGKQASVDTASRPKVERDVQASRGGEAAATNCPKCGSPMVKRTARRGNNAGSAFWGCTNFPKCRGTKSI